MADFVIPTVNIDEKAIFKKQNADLQKKIAKEANDTIEKTVQQNQPRVDKLVAEKDKQKFKNAGNGLTPREHASKTNTPYKDPVTGIEEVVVTAEPLGLVEESFIENDETKLSEYSERGRFNIDKLRYNFDQGARPNRYTVDFYCPPLGIALEGLRCQTASLPGRQLETGDFSEYGPTRKLPFNLSMDGQEVSFTFVCDSSFADRYIIDAWQGAIFTGTKDGGSSTSTIETIKTEKNTLVNPTQEEVDNLEGDITSVEKQTTTNYYANRAGLGSSVHPTFSYYENYVGEIVVKQITQQNKNSLVYRIHEAYPVSFAPMELSYASSDEILKFECTFAFRTWDSQYENPNPVSGINKGRRFLDILASTRNLRKGGNKANDTVQRFQDRLARLGGIFG
tara:strand:- start:943 stop:2127 length:1185 start_codon:yes stop_codon:yes gene_type:complete